MPFDSDNDVHSRKVKESNLHLSDIVFENKHGYARPVKRKIAAVKNFDLQPEAFRKKAKSRLPALLQQVKGEHLCVSLLLTSSFRINLQINHDHTWSPQYYTVKGTPPDSLVLRIIQPKTFSTPAIAYGIENKKSAVEEYMTYRQYEECKDIVVTPLGVTINSVLSFLGASSDWAVYNPSPLRSLTDSWR